MGVASFGVLVYRFTVRDEGRLDLNGRVHPKGCHCADPGGERCLARDRREAHHRERLLGTKLVVHAEAKQGHPIVNLLRGRRFTKEFRKNTTRKPQTHTVAVDEQCKEFEDAEPTSRNTIEPLPLVAPMCRLECL